MRSIVMMKPNTLKIFANETVATRSKVLAKVLVTAVFAWAMTAAAASAVPREVGIWIDDSGKGAVKIDICGNRLCGHIVWLKETVNAKGEPLFDRHNPDASKKTRPICGLQILGELAQMQGGGFDNGWVYDPKVGKSYSVALDLTAPDVLKVTGYKGMRFMGKTFIWTRAQSELPACDGTAARADDAAVPTTAPKAAAAKPAVAKPAGAKPPAIKSAGGTAPAKQAPPQAKKTTTEKMPWDAGPKPAAKPAPAKSVAPAP